MSTNDIIQKLTESIKVTSHIDNELFAKFNVKRGLRNEDHSGVLVGLTTIGDVVGYERQEGAPLKAIPGKLIYRGIDVEEIAESLQRTRRFGFEESVFLLLSGYLPTAEELESFNALITEQLRVEDMSKFSILQLQGHDIMNILARSVMIMYTFDEEADNTSRENLMKQAVSLIAKFPTIIAYAYHSMRHTYQGRTMAIRHPKDNLSIAENFLYMLKGPDNYTELDARVLDMALVLHADHGGGNNSTFTIRVTSSSGTDTYSSVTAAIGSLKGPLHGGANLKVIDMFNHLKDNISDWKDEAEIKAYLLKMLKKEAYNRTGLIYGIGHAVYTISDPRAEILKVMARDLAKEKGLDKEFAFLELLEKLSVETFMEFKGNNVNKRVCANVDFYSGFVYEMIGLPKEVFTPIFAMARIAGWMAHRIEELNFESKRIIRPAYKNVKERKPYIPVEERK
jgi:citrate synthase